MENDEEMDEEMEEGCAHETDYFWTLDPCQEAGWVCAECTAKLGFRPDLDRTHTSEKVDAILHELHDHAVLYVSNGTEGDIMVRGVTRHCHKTTTYDQQSIVACLLSYDDEEHAAFWRKEARAWLRERGHSTPEEEE